MYTMYMANGNGQFSIRQSGQSPGAHLDLSEKYYAQTVSRLYIKGTLMSEFI